MTRLVAQRYPNMTATIAVALKKAVANIEKRYVARFVDAPEGYMRSAAVAIPRATRVLDSSQWDPTLSVGVCDPFSVSVCDRLITCRTKAPKIPRTVLIGWRC